MGVILASPTPLHAQSTVEIQESAETSDSVPLEQPEVQSNEQTPELAAYEERSSLDQVRALVDLGAIQLAHHIVVNERSNYVHSLDEFEWEKLFFELSWKLELWEDSINRADELRESEIYGLAQTYAAQAQIQLKQYDSALKRIRKLVLQHYENQSTIIELRSLIAQIYLEKNYLADAEIALDLFDRDYRPSDPIWEHRYVRVLILNNRLQEASVRLVPLQTLEAQLLELYTQFRLQALSPSEVVFQGLEMEPEFISQPALHSELWSLIELAARSYHDFEIQTTAIESALSIGYTSNSSWQHLPIVPLIVEQQLLDTYDQYSTVLGNDFGMIIGDDDSWYQLAQEFEITSPITARAVHAYLARHAYTEEMRTRSTAALANLYFEAQMYDLLETLFVRTQLLDVSKVSNEIKTRLANTALRQNDFDQALTIIEVMPEPQEANELQSWRLTQARIAISIGEIEKGERFLDEVIAQLPQAASQEALDQVLQVVFDLQVLEQHDLAIQVFIKLFNKAGTPQSRREILRWISESYSVQGNHAMASALLLQSAMFGGRWDDQWALSARLKAGDELVKAQLFADARIIYTQLREDTIDPRNRSLVSSRLSNLKNSEPADSN